MTDEEILEIGVQAGMNPAIMSLDGNFKLLKTFANLVAEHERESCAKLCDDRVTAYQYATDSWAQEHIDEARHLSQAIRARGQE